MIITTSSLSPELNTQFIEDLSLNSVNVQKQYVLTNRVTSSYNSKVSPTKQTLKLVLPDDIQKRILSAAKGGSAIKMADAINKLTLAILAKNVDFKRSVSMIADYIDGQASSKVGKDRILASPSGHPDVYGLATESYLRTNRARRDRYNDIVMSAVMIRENYHQRSRYGIVINGTGVVPDLDMDHPLGRYMDAAVGLGQRHAALWSDNMSWLGLSKTEAFEYRFLAAKFPWWLQLMLMDCDLIRISTRRSWLTGNKPVPADPEVMQLYYPYYLLGQPALWHAKYSRLKTSSYFKAFSILKGSEPALASLDVDDMFKTGRIPVLGSLLFGRVEDAGLLRSLLAGVSLYKSPLSSSNQASSLIPSISADIVLKTFKQQLVYTDFQSDVRRRGNTVSSHQEKDAIPFFVSFKF